MAAVEHGDQLAIEHTERRDGLGLERTKKRWQVVQGGRLQRSDADHRLHGKRHVTGTKPDCDESRQCTGDHLNAVCREERAEVDHRNGLTTDHG
jgi:hypothetical protein